MLKSILPLSRAVARPARRSSWFVTRGQKSVAALRTTSSAATRRLAFAAPSAAAVIFSLLQRVSRCEGGDDDASLSRETKEEDDGEEDEVTSMMDRMSPFTGQLTFGMVAGACSGYALKRIGRQLAFGVGCVFIVAQGLSYSGYIEIKWNKVQQRAISAIDTDGDGRITMADMKAYWRRLRHVLTYNLPAGTGFTAGVASGLYLL